MFNRQLLSYLIVKTFQQISWTIYLDETRTMRLFSSWMHYQARSAFLDKLKSPADRSFSPNFLPNCIYCTQQISHPQLPNSSDTVTRLFTIRVRSELQLPTESSSCHLNSSQGSSKRFSTFELKFLKKTIILRSSNSYFY